MWIEGSRWETSRRVSYTLAYGDIPERKAIVTTCGTQLCVNPTHLALANLGRPAASTTKAAPQRPHREVPVLSTSDESRLPVGGSATRQKERR